MPQLFEKTWGESWKRPIAVPDMMQVWDSATRPTLGLLIVTILLGLLGGVIKTFLDLRLLLGTGLDVALRHIIVDALTLLAVVEVLKTTLTYCSDGVCADLHRRYRVGGDVDGNHLPVVFGRAMAALSSARRDRQRPRGNTNRRSAV